MSRGELIHRRLHLGLGEVRDEGERRSALLGDLQLAYFMVIGYIAGRRFLEAHFGNNGLPRWFRARDAARYGRCEDQHGKRGSRASLHAWPCY